MGRLCKNISFMDKIPLTEFLTVYMLISMSPRDVATTGTITCLTVISLSTYKKPYEMCCHFNYTRYTLITQDVTKMSCLITLLIALWYPNKLCHVICNYHHIWCYKEPHAKL